jgi:hypothetical protein
MGMDTKPDKQHWQEFITWKFWVGAVIADSILASLWWGLNKLVTIVPIVRDIGFLVLLIAGAFLVAWRLPKWAPEYGGTKTKATKTSLVKTPSRLLHDNVLWEDGGKSGWGIHVVGPLCPKDYAHLGSEHGDKIKSYIDYDAVISKSYYHTMLVCPECKSKYTLGKNPKTANESMGEVRNRFEGKRRREQED